MSRNWACFIIIATAHLLLASCTVAEPSEPPATQIADSLVRFGELQKMDGFTEGISFQETVTVWNCRNPLQRSDSLNEVRTVEKAIEWYIVGEVGADVEASVLAASASVNGTIASGYTLEVTDRLERSRSLELPVGSNSSVEYIVEWRPVVWSGFIPFIYQSGESRIEYQYERIAFGEVKDFHDRTAEDCGISSAAPQPGPTSTPFIPTDPQAPDLPTPVTEGIARFEVQAAIWKNGTGLSADAGDSIHIEYLEGQWTGDSSQPGLTEGCGFTWDDPVPEHVWLFPPEQRGAALVGYIDNEPFFVGCRPIDIVASISGELFLGMSDCLGCFWDNVGQLYVSISVNRQ
ncbi:MAG: hypothetical protein KC418_15485 [Anaerolineales bacterium]|nr:hypothetical protein [Anaerolineales bacterium]